MNCRIGSFIGGENIKMAFQKLDGYIPKSAKIMPIWIRSNDEYSKNDLVYLTDDEKYFVSIDHKRVHPVNENLLWDMVDIPIK